MDALQLFDSCFTDDGAGGFSGTHPSTGQQIAMYPVPDGAAVAVALDGRELRRFPSFGAAIGFLNKLVDSEPGREDEERAQMTIAARAAELADVINHSRIQSAGLTPSDACLLAQAYCDEAEAHGHGAGPELVRLALPLITDPGTKRALLDWLGT